MEGAAAICSAVRCWLRPPFFMSCHHFISCRRELPFSYVDLLAGRGNDRNRVLLTIPLKESTRVRCLGGGALKSMVLQMDFESWTCRHHALAKNSGVSFVPAKNLCGKALEFSAGRQKIQSATNCDNRVRFEVLFRGRKKKTRIQSGA